MATSVIDKMESLLRLNLHIPSLQRNFTWGAKQAGEFWDDVKDYAENPEDVPYYFGSVILYPHDGVYEIIDGQQRITTANLYISAIKDALLKINDKKLEAEELEIKNDLLEDIDDTISKSKKPRLKVWGEYQEYFEKIVINCEKFTDSKDASSSVKSMHAVRRAFISKITENIKHLSPYEKVLFLRAMFKCLINTEVVRLERATKLDANQLYDRVNTRGIKLAQPDLMKNYIYAFCDGEWTDESIAVRDWEYMRVNVHGGAENLYKFTMAYYQSRYGRISQSRLYAEFREKTGDGNPELIEAHVRRMKNLLPWYNYIVAPTTYGAPGELTPIECTYIRDIVLFSRVVHVPAILATVSAGIPAQIRKDILHNMLMFAIGISFTETNPRVFDDINNDYCTKLFGDDVDKSMEEKIVIAKSYVNGLNEKKIDRVGLIESLKVRNFEDNKTDTNKVKCLFRRIFERNTLVFPETVQLEHILPKNPDFEKGQWLDWAGHHKDYVFKLGNLTLFEGELNEGASNKEFIDKRDEYYKDSDFKMTCDLVKYAEWTKEIVEDRTNEFAGLVADLCEFHHYD